MTIEQHLAAAVDGLIYPSESDQPWHVFAWPASPGDAADQVRRHRGGPVAAVPLDGWFGELAAADDAGRYAALRLALANHLTRLTAVRAGDGAEVGVYLIGRMPDGRWAGVRTVSVET